MEFVIEPNRLQHMLNTALIGGLLDSTTGYFGSDGLNIEDKTNPFVGVKAFFSTPYFLSYRVDGEKEKIKLTKTMLKPLGFHEAFEAEKLKVFTKDNKVVYQTGGKEGTVDEFWNYDLEDPIENKFSFKIPDSEKGFIPVRQPELVQVYLRISQLRVHQCKKCKFISDGKKISVEVLEPGVYRRTLKLTKQPTLSEHELYVPGYTLEKIVKLYSGAVWLTLFEKAAVFSQKTKETSLTYLLSPYARNHKT